jgi:hypothetical protein
MIFQRIFLLHLQGLGSQSKIYQLIQLKLINASMQASNLAPFWLPRQLAHQAGFIWRRQSVCQQEMSVDVSHIVASD